MNPATKALSSIASAAANGIAGLIFLTRTGILAHRNRVWADSLLISPPNGPLAIGQQSPREFLTEARTSVSVKGCGVLLLRVRLAQIIRGERIHWPTRSSRSQPITASTTIWSVR